MPVGLALALFLQAAAWSDSFPRITIKTLQGDSFVLPDDLGAPLNILVVGFTRKAGSNTRPWTDRLRKDFTAVEGFAVYPVAVLADVPFLFRPMALDATRGSVPPEERRGFLVVDHDEDTWRTRTGYRLPDDPYVVVLDRAGTVLVRDRGLLNEDAYTDVAARIRSVAAGRP